MSLLCPRSGDCTSDTAHVLRMFCPCFWDCPCSPPPKGSSLYQRLIVLGRGAMAYGKFSVAKDCFEAAGRVLSRRRVSLHMFCIKDGICDHSVNMPCAALNSIEGVCIACPIHALQVSGRSCCRSVHFRATSLLCAASTARQRQRGARQPMMGHWCVQHHEECLPDWSAHQPSCSLMGCECKRGTACSLD